MLLTAAHDVDDGVSRRATILGAPGAIPLPR